MKCHACGGVFGCGIVLSGFQQERKQKWLPPRQLLLNLAAGRSGLISLETVVH